MGCNLTTNRRRFLAICFLGCFSSAEGSAQTLPKDETLERLAAKKITDSLIGLVNLTTAAGVDGMHLTVNGKDGQPDLEFDKFNVRIAKTWRTPHPKLDFYTELGFGDLIIEDTFVGTNINGDAITFRTDRNVQSARLGLGVEYRPTPEVWITPHVVGSWSQIRSETDVTGGSFNPAGLTPVESVLLLDWETKSWSLAAAIQVGWRHWFGEDQRLGLVVDYALAYNETYDESLPILATSGHSNALQLEIEWTSLTAWNAFGKPIYWNTFVQSVSFPGQDREDLGFNHYFGFGAGLGLYLNKSLFGDFAHLNFAGFEVTVFVGENVTGGSIGFSLRL